MFRPACWVMSVKTGRGTPPGPCSAEFTTVRAIDRSMKTAEKRPKQHIQDVFNAAILILQCSSLGPVWLRRFKISLADHLYPNSIYEWSRQAKGKDPYR